MTAKKQRVKWDPVLYQAAAIVDSYDTGVTLRQLFYRLVSLEILPNTHSYYTTLSSKTAEARREGWFPSLVDRTRSIHQYRTFTSAAQAKAYIQRTYRRDRTEGQPYTLYLGVEKHGIVNQLQAWFGDLGIPIVSLGGYSSQTYLDEIADHAESQNRPVILIYAGDFDASGHDIERDFRNRVRNLSHTVRIALTEAQILEYELPRLPGKESDTRALGFIEKFGSLFQVELDALPPEVLRDLYRAAIHEFFDKSIYDQVLAVEKRERDSL